PLAWRPFWITGDRRHGLCCGDTRGRCPRGRRDRKCCAYLGRGVCVSIPVASIEDAREDMWSRRGESHHKLESFGGDAITVTGEFGVVARPCRGATHHDVLMRRR